MDAKIREIVEEIDKLVYAERKRTSAYIHRKEKLGSDALDRMVWAERELGCKVSEQWDALRTALAGGGGATLPAPEAAYERRTTDEERVILANRARNRATLTEFFGTMSTELPVAVWYALEDLKSCERALAAERAAREKAEAERDGARKERDAVRAAHDRLAKHDRDTIARRIEADAMRYEMEQDRDALRSKLSAAEANQEHARRVFAGVLTVLDGGSADGAWFDSREFLPTLETAQRVMVRLAAAEARITELADELMGVRGQRHEVICQRDDARARLAAVEAERDEMRLVVEADYRMLTAQRAQITAAESRAARMREALQDAVETARQGRRGCVGDHYIHSPQIGEGQIERWSAALDAEGKEGSDA